MINVYREMLRLSRSVWPSPRGRYIARQVLHHRFKTGEVPKLEALTNTVAFMKAAAEANGLERRVLHTMLYVEASKYTQQRIRQRRKQTAVNGLSEKMYIECVEGLNRSCGLCL